MDNGISFDLLNSPLDGMNLIEASAGTGKTFTIAGLFLRLILEKGFLVNEILVVTFTEGATAELKERIRNGLQTALNAITKGRADEAFMQGLVRRHEESRLKARVRLEEALRQFDDAAIHTIHGFCGRILQENTFETGLPFGMELTADEEKVREEILLDFWRRHICQVSPLFFLYTQANRGRLEDLQRLVMEQALDPSLKIIPEEVGKVDTAYEEKAFLSSFHALQKAWQKDRAEVERILTSHRALNRNKYRKTSIPLWMEEMDDFFRGGKRAPVLPPSFSKFTIREIRLSIKKGKEGGEAWDYPFFKKCDLLSEISEKLEQAFAVRLVEIKRDLLGYMAKELVTRKESRRILFFDDLLTRLWLSLSGRGGDGLLSQIRSRFRAALIDEFQDTDPLQYAIFKKTFDSEGKILFMIGDPKQAIYGFRGADVFAYMKGARDAQSRFGLPQNWRSSPELIEAINAIFGNKARPFLYREIPFHAAKPAYRKDIDQLTLDGKEAHSFQLWFWPQEDGGGGKPLPKEAGRRAVAEAVAWEIGRLVSLGQQGRALIGNKAVSPKDIAVLVRKNRDATLMQQHLSALRVPSVLHSTGNVFDTHEARELEGVLAGIVRALEESRLMTALSTDMLGFKGDALDAMIKDASLMEARVVKIREYHKLWRRGGFYRMFRRLITEENILPRLMGYPNGERRVTNLLHLAELLHQSALKERFSMEGHLKWLKGQRARPRGEEHLLRLESDENAVKIMTIHKSKGMEYPIVFCPFSWDGFKVPSGGPFLFHDPERDRHLTLDLGSTKRDDNRALAEEESLSENLRLLYVALTRAKVCCYLVWGRFNQSASSAPAYLFHHPKEPSHRKVVEDTEHWVKRLDSMAMLQDLDRLNVDAKGAIYVTDPPKKALPSLSPLGEASQPLFLRSFESKIDRSWRIASFSSLISGLPAAADWADRDEDNISDPVPALVERRSEEFQEGADLFSFPTGTRTGIFFHDLLEHFDFTEKNPGLVGDLVVSKLYEHSLDLTWRDAIVHSLDRVVSVALKMGKEEFSLSQISQQQRLNEVAFYYPIKRASPQKMSKLMTPWGTGLQKGRVTFSPFRGFMKGYIDLIFEHGGRYYLVDWKSNYLGNHFEDYGPKALARAMIKGHYVLQCHIYALALYQYLKYRVPGFHYDTHYGGIFFVFLRGLDPNRGQTYGIYRDRPPEEQLNTWVTDLIP